jgi:hypothetical protein
MYIQHDINTQNKASRCTYPMLCSVLVYDARVNLLLLPLYSYVVVRVLSVSLDITKDL